MDQPQYERPNTVSGLKAKHKELTALRKKYVSELQRLNADIEHLSACILIFDPTAHEYKMKAHVTSPRAARGSVKTFVLSALREASEPLTTRQLCEAWIEGRGIEIGEKSIFTAGRRISSSISSCVRQGLVERAIVNGETPSTTRRCWKIASSVEEGGLFSSD